MDGIPRDQLGHEGNRGEPFGIAPPQYRLPSGSHVGAVDLLVSHLDRSLAFYERVVGLHTLKREPDAAVLGAHDRPLVVLHTRPGVRSAPRGGGFGLYHFAILLPDRVWLGRFASHLARIGLQPGMADHAVSEALYLADPDGLGIEVYADRPRAQWRHADRQLVMTTEPLEIRGLMEAGEGGRFDGLPSGATIGHMHLHVGDLDTASAFYHAALGFDRIVWDFPGALFLAAGGYHHHLGVNTWARRPVPPDHARLMSWELVVPHAADVTAAADSLVAAGYPVAREPARALVNDPWGTSLHLVSPDSGPR